MTLATMPETLGEVSPKQFREAMRHLAGGVTVITAGRGDERTGLTVTSFSALSAEPPRVIVCVHRASSSLDVIVRDRQFGASFLAAHHEDVAARFAGRGGIKGVERYAGGAWQTLPSGVVVLGGALAALDCEVEEILERHSHAIVIAKVRGVFAQGGSGALLYWRGGFDQLGWSLDTADLSTGG